MILELWEDHRYECETEEDHPEYDRRFEKDLFDTTFRTVDVSFAAESRTETGATCLKQDRSDEKYCDRKLYDVEIRLHEVSGLFSLMNSGPTSR